MHRRRFQYRRSAAPRDAGTPGLLRARSESADGVDDPEEGGSLKNQDRRVVREAKGQRRVKGLERQVLRLLQASYPQDIALKPLLLKLIHLLFLQE